jgi:hypothetical protein
VRQVQELHSHLLLKEAVGLMIQVQLVGFPLATSKDTAAVVMYMSGSTN